MVELIRMAKEGCVISSNVMCNNVDAGPRLDQKPILSRSMQLVRDTVVTTLHV